MASVSMVGAVTRVRRHALSDGRCNDWSERRRSGGGPAYWCETDAGRYRPNSHCAVTHDDIVTRRDVGAVVYEDHLPHCNLCLIKSP